MNTTKCIGIWIDHSSAHLTELTSGQLTTTVIVSKANSEGDHGEHKKSEHVQHNKEQHQDHDYYKHLGTVIRGYQDVLLYGPTDAKTELHNILKADHLFNDVRIEVKPADKMSDNQQHAFVRAHFSTH
jgi:hypothetical protein